MYNNLLLVLSLLFCANYTAAAEKNIHTIVHYKHEVFTLESPGKATYTVRKKYSRLNADAPGDLVTFDYEGDRKLKYIKVRIFDNSGEQIADFNEADFRDQKIVDRRSIFMDRRSKVLDVSHPDYPYTIEYEYEYVINEICGIYDWKPAAFNTQTLVSSYTCVVPRDYLLHFKPINFDNHPQLSTDADQDTYRWEIQNPDVIEREASMPVSELVLPMVLISPSAFETEGYSGDMSTWKNFGKYLYEINKGRDKLPPSFRDEILEMTKSAKSEREQIEILYKYMQKQCSYVSVQIGDSGWQTIPADYVAQHKYGDSKALTNFMKAMLKVVGIPANMVVISAGQDHAYIDQNFVNEGFNHTILYVPSEDMWLECTRNNTPAGYLGSYTHDRLALICSQEGGELKRTPVYNYQFNTSTFVTDIYYGAEGDAKVEEKKTLQGINQEPLRLSMEHGSDKEIRERILASYNVPIQAMDELEISLHDMAPEIELSKSFTINLHASKSGKRLFINLAPLQNYIGYPGDEPNRAQPYQIDHGFTIIDTLRIHYPENFEMEDNSLEDLSREEPFGTYSIAVTQEDKMLTIVRKLQLKKVTILPAGYKTYNDFFKMIKKTENNKLMLVNLRP